MKKVLLFVFAAGMLTLTSCRKDYVCACKDATDPNDKQDIPITNAKKSEAETTCSTANTLWTLGGGSCTLK